MSWVVGPLPHVWAFRSIVEFDSGYRNPQYGRSSTSPHVLVNTPFSSYNPVDECVATTTEWIIVGSPVEVGACDPDTAAITVHPTAAYEIHSETATAAAAWLADARFSSVLTEVEELDTLVFPPFE